MLSRHISRRMCVLIIKIVLITNQGKAYTRTYARMHSDTHVLEKVSPYARQCIQNVGAPALEETHESKRQKKKKSEKIRYRKKERE